VANSKRKCAHCKERKPVGAMLIKEPQAFCNIDHWIEYKVSIIPKAKIKQAKLKESEVKARHKKKLKELRTRTEWYNLLQIEVNKYVRNLAAHAEQLTQILNTMLAIASQERLGQI
jgi:hypothetical protein